MAKGKLVALLLHHGRTEFNESGRYTGNINVPLAHKGVLDARRAGQVIAEYPIERVVSSPLDRAVETAQLATAALGGRYIQQSNELLPWQLTPFWGKGKEEFDEELEYFISNPDKSPDDGESLHDFMDRQEKFMQKVINPHSLVLVVAHTTNLIAMKDIVEGTEDHEDCIKPGGIAGIYEDPDGDYCFDVLLGEESEAE